jgi:hypothetical protein
MPQQLSTPIGSREPQNVRRRAVSTVLRHAMALAEYKAPLHMRRAKPADFRTVQQMINGAKDRLRDLGTDQWSDDGWSDNAGRGRMARVRHSIEKRNTWIAELRIQLDMGIVMFPVATVTIERKGSPIVWDEHERKKYPAVYLSRLVVVESFSSFDIGASIIDWAGRRGLEQRNAKSIRIDVWTTNTALHCYYLNRGFQDCGMVSDTSYPAGKRFERSTLFESRLKRHVFPATGGRLRLAENSFSFEKQLLLTDESPSGQPASSGHLVDA